MPLLGNPTAAVLYPGKLIYAKVPYAWGARLYVVAHTLLAVAGMFALMRSWGVSRSGSGLAALGYAFGAPILFQYCNIIFLVGAAWTPLGLRAADRLAAAGEAIGPGRAGGGAGDADAGGRPAGGLRDGALRGGIRGGPGLGGTGPEIDPRPAVGRRGRSPRTRLDRGRLARHQWDPERRDPGRRLSGERARDVADVRGPARSPAPEGRGGAVRLGDPRPDPPGGAAGRLAADGSGEAVGAGRLLRAGRGADGGAAAAGARVHPPDGPGGGAGAARHLPVQPGAVPGRRTGLAQRLRDRLRGEPLLARRGPSAGPARDLGPLALPRRADAGAGVDGGRVPGWAALAGLALGDRGW